VSSLPTRLIAIAFTSRAHSTDATRATPSAKQQFGEAEQHERGEGYPRAHSGRRIADSIGTVCPVGATWFQTSASSTLPPHRELHQHRMFGRWR